MSAQPIYREKSGQWAVGSGQWAVGSGQWAVGSGQCFWAHFHFRGRRKPVVMVIYRENAAAPSIEL